MTAWQELREAPGYHPPSRLPLAACLAAGLLWLQLLPVDGGPELWKAILPLTLQCRDGGRLFLLLISASSHYFLYDPWLVCHTCDEPPVLNSLSFSSLEVFSGWAQKRCSGLVKNLPADAGDAVFVPGSGRSPGGGNGNPLQYFCLENPMDQRSLEGSSPWGLRESDTTEPLSMHTHTYPLRQQYWFRNLTCIFTCVRYRIIHCVVCNTKRWGIT